MLKPSLLLEPDVIVNFQRFQEKNVMINYQRLHLWVMIEMKQVDWKEDFMACRKRVWKRRRGNNLD